MSNEFFFLFFLKDHFTMELGCGVYMKRQFPWKAILGIILIAIVVFLGCRSSYQNYLESEEKIDETTIANQLKEKSDLLASMFQTFRPYDVTLDFQNVEDRLGAIKEIFWLQDYQDSLFITKDNTGMQPMRNIYLNKKYIQEKSKEIFDLEITDNDLQNINKIEEDYYNTGAPIDGGLPNYYPVLNKYVYDEQTNQIKIYLLDYHSISETLENYFTTSEISDERLAELGLLDKVNLLVLDVQIENNEAYLLKSEFIYKEDLSTYDALDYRNPDFYENTGHNFLESLTSKDKVIEFIQKNGFLIGALFKTYAQENVVLDFQDLKNRINFIRDFGNLTGFANEVLEYKDNDGPTSFIYLPESYLKEQSTQFFHREITSEELESLEKIEGPFYDVGIRADGGNPSYYPILNKVVYDEQEDIYSLYILDYRSIDKNLTDYEKITTISDEELKEKNLFDNINLLQIDYQKKDGKNILVSSKFTYKEDLNTLEK